LQLFACSRCLVTSFELLTATIGPRASLLRYLDLPIENALRGEKLGQNRGRGHRILTASESFLTFRAPNFCAKFHLNRTKIATVEVRTERRKDASSLITDVGFSCAGFAYACG